MEMSVHFTLHCFNHWGKVPITHWTGCLVCLVTCLETLEKRKISFHLWLIGRHSPLLLENKIIIYKTVLKPVWMYGIELWGCASNSSIEIIQRYQSKILRIMTNAPWYVTNHTLHSDLHIPYVRDVFQERIAIHRTAIASHPNPLMASLLHLPTTRRLRRRWALDGTHYGGVVGHILRSPTNKTRTLAKRKWCTVNVFWLLITVLIKKNVRNRMNWSKPKWMKTERRSTVPSSIELSR
jgi:hypothetical protein